MASPALSNDENRERRLRAGRTHHSRSDLKTFDALSGFSWLCARALLGCAQFFEHGDHLRIADLLAVVAAGDELTPRRFRDTHGRQAAPVLHIHPGALA